MKTRTIHFLFILLFPLATAKGQEAPLKIPNLLDGVFKAEAHETAIAVKMPVTQPKKKFTVYILRSPGAETEITGQIVTVEGKTVTFVYKDNYGNTGKGTLKSLGKEKYVIDFQTLKLVEPRTARLVGKYNLTETKKQK